MASNIIKTKILQRLDTEGTWQSINPRLSVGELVFSVTESGTFMKLGDGRNYNDTPFYQDIRIDNQIVSSLYFEHIALSDYENLVTSEQINPNTVYVVSSESWNAYGEQIKNVAEATDLSDAVPLWQISSMLSGGASAGELTLIKQSLLDERNTIVEFTDGTIEAISASGTFTTAYLSGKTAKSVKFGTAISVIDDFLFDGNSSLTSVSFSEGLVTVSKYAFNGTNLKKVVLPESFAETDDNAFMVVDTTNLSIIVEGKT